MKPQDQSKRHTDKRLDFRGHSRDGRGANRFIPLTRTPKEILAAKANKFQPPPPMVTPVEKRNSNKFCDFHNEKGHNTDECMQLKKQIKELVRARKPSHLIKEIKQGREQPKTGRKEAAAKDKPMTIYMVRSWQRTVKQKVTQSFEPGKEIAFPPLTTSNETERPLVIEAEIGGHVIHRMYIDGGSSMEILYEHCFNRLQPEIKSQMVPATTSLTGFGGETTWPLGQLRLLVTIGDATHSTKAWMKFMVVKSSPYNGIIGLPGLKAIQAVPSTVHGMLKFPTEGGIVTICSSLLIPAECASIGTSSGTPRGERTRPTNFTVALHPNFPDQEVVVGGSLSDRGRTELCALLKKNLDIFAWQPSDMTGVPRSVAEHRLNIREGCPPDCYPLPEIDWKVESLYGYPFKCFLDAYKGYHQIQLAEADGEKTAFHTRQGVYCYTKMPFGLKNAGATYQRVMDKAFERQMGQNIEVYVDDLVVKSYTEMEMVRDIEETFRTLRKINMKLNPKKCSFGLAEGVFLGYVITPEGIKPCPDKTAAVLQLPSPQTVKEVQSLNGKLASLNSGASVLAAKAAFIRSPSIGRTQTAEGADHVMSRPDVAGRLQKWSIMLGEHNITYRPRTSVKGQILADFLNEIPGNALQAEYEALVAGLRIATQMGVKNVQVNVDSKLVANQVLGTYVAKEDNMIKYLEIVKGLVSGFTTFSISQVPRSKNKKADALSKIASTSFPYLSKQVLVEVLETKSLAGKEITAVIEEEGPTWMIELVDYLKKGILPGGEKEARKLHLKARQYELMEGVLYKRSFLTPWLRYVGPLQAEYVIREIHEGSCSMHAGPRPLSGGAGEGQIPDSHHGLLHKVDRSKGGGYDYRRAERANRSLREGIKARLREGNKNWVEELPHVLWAHQTMIKSSHGDTPFSLTYGTEAVIPAEIGMPTYRTAAVDVVNNDEELRLNLDLLEERRELATVREANSKSKMMKYYNARVRGMAFKPGDFVYRSNDASHAAAGGKLGPKWEGPYEVTEALGNGAYKLRSTNGTVLPRTWDVTNLKRCYL
nr:reverse transcriptase domain-containing protein [Tanacetum cinerariifolium]